MRIVTWNCNGALRRKLSYLDSLEADLYVVQECEDPASTSCDAYRRWASNFLWTGSNRHKGLGVFASRDILLELVDLSLKPLELFLPCRINGTTSLMAAWTREAGSPTFRYIGQLWKLLQRHSSFLQVDKAILIGDLNSNSCWDVSDRWWNHTDVVRELGYMGLRSAYHYLAKEEQGQESTPTFYMYRKKEKPYHIDYSFVSQSLLPGAACSIGDPATWLDVSDHMPLVVEIPVLGLP